MCVALAGLPLQGIAAVTMEHCPHNAGTIQSLAPVADHGDDGHAHPHSAPGQAGGETMCLDCSPCHLCSAFALPIAPVALSSNAGFPLLPVLAASFSGFLPEQPQRPPLA